MKTESTQTDAPTVAAAPPGRRLIVNADDLGLCPAVNRGIIVAHTRGIVTSASLMVRQPGAAAGVAAARRHPGLSLGLHVDLGEWEYRSGAWVARYSVVPTGDPNEIAAEVARQLGAFHRFVGAAPTHLDSHQHVHFYEPALTVLKKVAERLEIPLRNCSPLITFRGDLYGQTYKGQPVPQALSVGAVTGLIAGLGPGVTELVCHPADSDDVPSTYRAERVIELETLCDPQVRTALGDAGVELCSFHDLRPGEHR